MRAPNPNCAVCGNAYNTRWVCAPCRRDPANVEWLEGRELSASDAALDRAEQPGWNAVEAWQPGSMHSAVAQMMVLGEMSMRETARALGVPLSRVRGILADFRELGPEE